MYGNKSSDFLGHLPSLISIDCRWSENRHVQSDPGVFADGKTKQVSKLYDIFNLCLLVFFSGKLRMLSLGNAKITNILG